LPKARTVKIELGTGENMNMFEVQVISSGNEIARNKSARQSSTFKTFSADRALDGDLISFSHTNGFGSSVWWEVDLGDEYPIESVTIMNRWCGSVSDPNSCLCRLSSASLSLIDGQNQVTSSKVIGDTCKKTTLSFDFSC
jgi:phage-related protein